MAPTNIIASHAIDAMETITPHSNNPLQDQVVHADIVVTGIDDNRTLLKRKQTNASLIEQPNLSDKDAEKQAQAEDMRTWWNTEMKKHMNQPDGYARVAVLLIKWADELDELKTKKETDELGELFRDRFHYQTNTIELNVGKRPQLQLDNHISNFLLEHDGPDNLLIVYYTGHGLFHDDKRFLELSACTNPEISKGFSREAKANWNKVEEKLRDEDVEGDVLTILDTCYASNLVTKSGRQETKKFELMAASSINETTARPGKNSFTRALIDGLKELLDKQKEPISTFRMVQTINLNTKRRDTAHVWARNPHNDQHIFLAPLKSHTPDKTKPSTSLPTPGGYLTLKFGLRDPCLNKEQIEYMTKLMATALCNKSMIGLRKLEWLQMKPAPPTHLDRVASVLYAAKQWKKVVKERKQRAASQLESQQPVGESQASSPTNAQKRAQEGMDESPDAKRQHLDPALPRSPVSNASPRIDH